MSLLSSNFGAIASCALLLSLSSNATLADPGASKSTRAARKLFVYVGGYTKGKTKGIFIYSMNPSTGKLTPEGVGPDVESPSYLVIHPNHKFLYAVNEISNYEGKSAGAVSSYQINAATGGLTLINQKTSGGDGPCHITIDSQGKNVIVANYGGGSAEVLPVHEDGSLGDPSCFVQHTGTGPDVSRQEGPHGHCAVIDPTGKYAFVCDLGTDKIVAYKYDASAGTIDSTGMAPGTVAPGSGPRHLAFHPNGKIAYCINEMKSTVTAFNYDAATAGLKEIQTISTLPSDFAGQTTTAEIVISSDGKFLYGSNRGHDSIAIFSIGQTGELKALGNVPTQGKTPRCFNIDPTGSYLIAANQNSDNIVVFKRNKRTGGLTATGQVLEAPSPVCVVFLQQ